MSEHVTPGPDMIMGDSGDNWLSGGGGADTIDGGAGMDWVAYLGSDVGVSVDLSPGGINRGGHAEGDVLINIENVFGSMHNDEIIGDIGNNMLMGNGGSDEIMGGGGHDTLHGNEGNDALDGGAGNDMLMGGQGDDMLMGGMGDDTITGGMGADVIDGGAGTDWVRYADSMDGVTVDLGSTGSGGKAEGDTFTNIEGVIGSQMADRLVVGDYGGMAYGYQGDDMLFGGKGDATLGGGKGDDTLDAGAGSNTLTGGMGDDTFILWTGVGDVTNKLDFAAGDMIKFGAAADGVPKKLSSEDVDAILDNGKHTSAGYEYVHKGVTFITPIALTESSFYGEGAPVGGGSMNQVNLTNDDDVWPGAGDVNSEADHIRAKAGDDEIYAGMGDDLVDAGADDDMAYGGSGDDTIYGGTGHDMLSGDALDGEVPETANEPGNDVMYGGAGNDMMSGNEGHDELHGGAGNDTMNGNDGRDELYGDADTDMLYGGAGRDMLDGGAGNDELTGGSGNDLIKANKGDTVDGDGVEDSDDTAIASPNTEGTSDTVSYAGTDAGVTVDLEVATAPDEHEAVTNVENFIGSEKGDHVDGGGGVNDLEGGGGNDTLNGAAGNDMLDGGAGNDMVAGGDGMDTVKGGAGDDKISGGTFVTIVEDGADTNADQDDDRDVLTGGAGSDTFTWGDGDTITDYSRGDKIDHISVDQDPVTTVDPSFSMVDHDDKASTPDALAVTVSGETMYFEGLDMSDTGDLVWT